MNLNSKTNGIFGDVSIVKTNIVGDVLEKIYIPNLVVAVGKNYIASRIIGVTPTVMTNIAVGTSNAAASATDTTLVTEIGRVVLSTSTVNNNVVTYTATFPAGTATGALTEAGIFNAGTAGVMLARTTFPIVTKQAADVISITWNITIS